MYSTKVLAPRTLREQRCTQRPALVSVGHRLSWRSPRCGRHKNCRSGNGMAAVDEPVIPPVAPFAKRGRTGVGSMCTILSKLRAGSSLTKMARHDLHARPHPSPPPPTRTLPVCDTHTATLRFPQILASLTNGVQIFGTTFFGHPLKTADKLSMLLTQGSNLQRIETGDP